MKILCKNPNHKLHVADFVKKYPTAKGRGPADDYNGRPK